MNNDEKRDVSPGQPPYQGLGEYAARPTPEAAEQRGGNAVSGSDLKQKVADDYRSLSDTARQGFDKATEKAEDAVEEQKNALASRLGGIALAMNKVADELDEGDNRDIAALTRTAGSSMGTFSKSIENKSLGEVAGMAEDFGRKQPLAFLGLAAIAGLAASRFLTASTQHHDDASVRPSTTPASGPASVGVSTPNSGSGLSARQEGRLYD